MAAKPALKTWPQYRRENVSASIIGRNSRWLKCNGYGYSADNIRRNGVVMFNKLILSIRPLACVSNVAAKYKLSAAVSYNGSVCHLWPCSAAIEISRYKYNRLWRNGQSLVGCSMAWPSADWPANRLWLHSALVAKMAWRTESLNVYDQYLAGWLYGCLSADISNNMCQRLGPSQSAETLLGVK